MEIFGKDLEGAAKEVIECRTAAKEAYNSIEATKEVLTKKLIVLDRAGKVPDVEESMNEFTNALEEYWQKWESVRMGYKKVQVDADTAINATSGSGASSETGTTSSDFIRSNPTPDARPGFLERESLLLDELNWNEQAT